MALPEASPLPEMARPDLWPAYLRENAVAAAAPQPGELAYGTAKPATTPAPGSGIVGMHPAEVAALYDIPLNTRPSFGVFQGLAKLGRRA
jgi:hypothetical protein